MHNEVATQAVTQTQVIIALAIFVSIYGLLILEKVHRAVLAVIGGVLMVLAGIFNQEKAFHAIDFNTIGLLAGMMIIVVITKRTGLFEYLAILSAKKSKGDPWKIMMLFAIVTAVCSAFLDNVTTVILIAPVTLVIAETLEVNPVPYLLVEVLFSNIGGTATLIGDPPNIMIGSKTNLSFMDFMWNLTPVIIVIGIATMAVLYFIYGRHLKVAPEIQARIMTFKEKEAIKDVPLLKKCLFVIGVTVMGFVLHGVLHLEAATIALCSAGLLMLIMGGSHEDVDHALEKIEWTTIFFFMGLFVIVHGIEHVGVIKYMAEKMMTLTQGDVKATSMIILWGSAILSAFVDNIPFTATMIPLIKDFGQLAQIKDLNPLWWSLSLGACLGGNGSLIGASANIVVAGISTKAGFPINFMGFLKLGFPLMILSIVISTVYIWFRYLAHLG